MVDTDVLIDYLRDHPRAAAFLEAQKDPFWVLVISVAELFSGVRDGAEREALEGLLKANRLQPPQPPRSSGRFAGCRLTLHPLLR